jgi:hypothetical protein
LRIVSGLNVGIEIGFINAGLPSDAWLSVPGVGAQLDVTEFLHGEATPDAWFSWRHRQASIAPSAKLIAKHMEPA